MTAALVSHTGAADRQARCACKTNQVCFSSLCSDPEGARAMRFMLSGAITPRSGSDSGSAPACRGA